VYEITNWEHKRRLVTFEKEGREWAIESGILKPFFDDKHGQLQSFRPMPDVARIIFPYSIVQQAHGALQARVIPPAQMRTRFPNAYKYLSHYKTPLKDRDISPKPYPPKEWYRYGRDQALTSFEHRPKIVVGVNSLGDKYVYDSSDTLLAGLCPYRDLSIGIRQG
jgi:hypothetical protein